MSRDSEFFREQANLERSRAAEATLENVVQRCERSAASWEAMALRAERAERLREERKERAADEAAIASSEPLPVYP